MQYRQQHGMEVHSNSYRLVRWKRFKDHRIAGWRAVGGGAFQWDEAGRFRRHTAHGAGGPAHRGLGRHRLHDRRGRLSFEEGLDIFHDLVFGVPAPDFSHDIAQGERKHEGQNGAAEDPNRSVARRSAAADDHHQASGNREQQPHTLVNRPRCVSQSSFGDGQIESHDCLQSA